jgi:hypothetical protein
MTVQYLGIWGGWCLARGGSLPFVEYQRRISQLTKKIRYWDEQQMQKNLPLFSLLALLTQRVPPSTLSTKSDTSGLAVGVPSAQNKLVHKNVGRVREF